MRSLLLAVLMSIPLMGMASPKAQPTMRTASQEKVKEILQAPAKFGMFAQNEYTVSGLNLIITCGTVNATNLAYGYTGDNFYFNTYFKTDGRPKYISTEFFSIDDLAIQIRTVGQMPEDDPRRELTTGFEACMYKMK